MSSQIRVNNTLPCRVLFLLHVPVSSPPALLLPRNLSSAAHTLDSSHTDISRRSVVSVPELTGLTEQEVELP